MLTTIVRILDSQSLERTLVNYIHGLISMENLRLNCTKWSSSPNLLLFFYPPRVYKMQVIVNNWPPICHVLQMLSPKDVLLCHP
ncbi:hypothetical protein BRADI_2g23376v3 [Brachypodium distachyon]|uniref:Uncharacterized protein n=1 Tax=Brachypodium distachyon TaxID=15368 RepID=A0A0Q3G3N5_BRADI|nr:hypothetical protein BRADI_2g23376v3 [Brachypodium distachyon]